MPPPPLNTIIHGGQQNMTPPHVNHITRGVGQRSDGGGLARDSRQIREVTKLDFKFVA